MNEIGGMNVRIVWRPAPMPPERSEISQPGDEHFSRRTREPSTNTVAPSRSKKSMNAPPIVCVSQKTRNIIARKIGMPRMRFSITRSIASVTLWRSPRRHTTSWQSLSIAR